MSEHPKLKYWLALVATFLFTLVFARFIVDAVQHGTPLHHESWTSIYAWIAPLGFALISVFAYWYRNTYPKS